MEHIRNCRQIKFLQTSNIKLSRIGNLLNVLSLGTVIFVFCLNLDSTFRLDFTFLIKLNSHFLKINFMLK